MSADLGVEDRVVIAIGPGRGLGGLITASGRAPAPRVVVPSRETVELARPD